jgi:UDP-N-acetylglucosamine 3-dehydrogenase
VPGYTAMRYSSLCELIAAQPYYCVIAAPTVSHEEIALELIANGINFLVEKPLAHNAEAAFAIAEKAAARSVKGCVGHVERFNSAVKEAKKRIIEGQLGEIYQISTSRQGPFPARISDVGVVKDLATHDIDLTTWLSGSSYESVSAQSVHRSGREHEDMISVSARMKNGVIVNHNVNWLSPRKIRQVVIIGEKGLLEIDLLSADLLFYANGVHKNEYKEIAHFKGVSQGDVVKYSFNRVEPLLTEHVEFQLFLQEKASDTVSLAEGVGILKVADGIQRSQITQQLVNL